ncbi:MAG TPA: ParB/RepB/Spo0J family partition protein [Anaerolineae bacterium]|nr:ParB/RepB/Spo0J family partition protein [Anaerolineae bacterium]
MARKRPLVDLTPTRKTRNTTDLDALFSADSAEKSHLLSIPVSAIEADPTQPRTVFDDQSLQELAGSLKQDGLIQPIEVIQLGRNRYQIVHGERRWRAAKLLGWEKISAIVRKFDYDKVTKFVRQMVENIQREDLNDVDRAAGLLRLKDLMQGESQAANDSKKTWRKTTWADVADRIGYSRQRVSQLTKLLQLPEEVQASIMQGSLSERDTRIFHRLTARQQRALHRARVVDGILSQAETKRVADYIKRGATQSVAVAIQAVQNGTDKFDKNRGEQIKEQNSRSVTQLGRSLERISAETLSPAEQTILLADLQQVQTKLDQLIQTLSSN